MDAFLIKKAQQLFGADAMMLGGRKIPHVKLFIINVKSNCLKITMVFYKVNPRRFFDECRRKN